MASCSKVRPLYGRRDGIKKSGWKDRMQNFEEYKKSDTEPVTGYDEQAGNNPPGRKVFPGSACIVIVCCVIFVFFDLIAPYALQRSVYGTASLNAYFVTERGEYFRLLTYMFLHGNIQHLGNNMILIFFLGNEVERFLGKGQFFFVYFFTGIVAGIVSIVYNILGGNPVSSIGASGAGFGLIGAVICILLANRKQRGSAVAKRVILFAAISLYAGFSEQGIDNAAHVGGLISGVAATAFLIWIRRRRNEG